ncbi:MAG: quinone oxidoreductase, partial [Alphaproteobacteria bacterium]|nr:quinone oxidoreductase [Alphaproteobacteria bacterium]
MQTKLVRFYQPGGPEVLKLDTAELGSPGPGEALIRHVAIGLNYMDVYHRSGAYPLPLPSACGGEAAGIVEAVGAGVSEVAPGDRVVYAGGAPGAYAERRLFPAARLVRIPDGVSDEIAAAVLLKG